MIIGAGRRDRLRLGGGDQHTGIVTVKAIVHPDTQAEAEATAAVPVVAIDADAITDKKVERS